MWQLLWSVPCWQIFGYWFRSLMRCLSRYRDLLGVSVGCSEFVASPISQPTEHPRRRSWPGFWHAGRPQQPINDCFTRIPFLALINSSFVNIQARESSSKLQAWEEKTDYFKYISDRFTYTLLSQQILNKWKHWPQNRSVNRYSIRHHQARNI